MLGTFKCKLCMGRQVQDSLAVACFNPCTFTLESAKHTATGHHQRSKGQTMKTRQLGKSSFLVPCCFAKSCAMYMYEWTAMSMLADIKRSSMHDIAVAAVLVSQLQLDGDLPVPDFKPQANISKSDSHL